MIFISDKYILDNFKDSDIVQIIIDPETGDIEGYIKTGDMIVRRESRQAYKNERDKYEPADKRKFTKVFHHECRKLTELRKKGELSVAGELLFRTLGDYIDFSGDNIVKIGNMAMGTKTIGEQLMGYSRQQTTKLLNELIDLNLVAKVKRGRQVIYIINPEYYHRGKVLKTTANIFRIKTDNIEWDLD